MKVLGIVAEYNPFHKGHAYHLKEAKKAAKADYSVAIMSSNFLQRGQPALFNKWQRAEMAILNGLDLVIELPVLFSARSAWYFAFNSLYILNNTGLVSHLAFGLEEGKAEDLEGLAAFLAHENEDYKSVLKNNLGLGLSLPAARELAIKEFFPSFSLDLNQPNLILALNYLKAIKLLESPIEPVYVERIGHYHGSEVHQDIASATHIRSLIERNQPAYKNYLPAASLEVIERLYKEGFKPVFLEDFSREIFYSLRKANLQELKNILSINEGLENRLLKSLSEAANLEDMIRITKSKRYPESRVQRIMAELLLGMTKDYSHDLPLYIRVLAFNSKGKEVITLIKEKSKLPLIDKFASNYKKADKNLKRQLDFEVKATNIYALAQKTGRYGAYQQEFTSSPLYLSD